MGIYCRAKPSRSGGLAPRASPEKQDPRDDSKGLTSLVPPVNISEGRHKYRAASVKAGAASPEIDHMHLTQVQRALLWVSFKLWLFGQSCMLPAERTSGQAIGSIFRRLVSLGKDRKGEVLQWPWKSLRLSAQNDGQWKASRLGSPTHCCSQGTGKQTPRA